MSAGKPIGRANPEIGYICRIQWWCALRIFAEIWYLHYFEYAKFDIDVLFSVLDLFLKVMSKRSIWHFYVIWVISQQFPSQRLEASGFSFFCLMKSCVSRKLFMSRLAVPHQSVSIASFTALTEEDIDIIRQRGFKVKESQYKQCGVIPHFQIYWKKNWEKVINYRFRKVNIDTTNWEKTFDRSTDLS